jgi:hypothetical protein
LLWKGEITTAGLDISIFVCLVMVAEPNEPLELLLFLRCNFHLWNVDTIQDLIDHPIVLATDDAVDGSDNEDSD